MPGLIRTNGCIIIPNAIPNSQRPRGFGVSVIQWPRRLLPICSLCVQFQFKTSQEMFSLDGNCTWPELTATSDFSCSRQIYFIFIAHICVYNLIFQDDWGFSSVCRMDVECLILHVQGRYILFSLPIYALTTSFARMTRGFSSECPVWLDVELSLVDGRSTSLPDSQSASASDV